MPPADTVAAAGMADVALAGGTGDDGNAAAADSTGGARAADPTGDGGGVGTPSAGHADPPLTAASQPVPPAVPPLPAPPAPVAKVETASSTRKANATEVMPTAAAAEIYPAAAAATTSRREAVATATPATVPPPRPPSEPLPPRMAAEPPIPPTRAHTQGRGLYDEAYKSEARAAEARAAEVKTKEEQAQPPSKPTRATNAVPTLAPSPSASQLAGTDQKLEPPPPGVYCGDICAAQVQQCPTSQPASGHLRPSVVPEATRAGAAIARPTRNSATGGAIRQVAPVAPPSLPKAAELSNQAIPQPSALLAAPEEEEEEFVVELGELLTRSSSSRKLSFKRMGVLQTKGGGKAALYNPSPIAWLTDHDFPWEAARFPRRQSPSPTAELEGRANTDGGLLTLEEHPVAASAEAQHASPSSKKLEDRDFFKAPPPSAPPHYTQLMPSAPPAQPLPHPNLQPAGLVPPSSSPQLMRREPQMPPKTSGAGCKPPPINTDSPPPPPLSSSSPDKPVPPAAFIAPTSVHYCWPKPPVQRGRVAASPYYTPSLASASSPSIPSPNAQPLSSYEELAAIRAASALMPARTRRGVHSPIHGQVPSTAHGGSMSPEAVHFHTAITNEQFVLARSMPLKPVPRKANASPSKQDRTAGQQQH